MRYFIAGLVAVLLAANAEGRTTAGQALPIKTEPGQPIEATIVGGSMSATVIEGVVEITGSLYTQSVSPTGATVSGTTLAEPVLNATNEANSTLRFPAMVGSSLDDSVPNTLHNSRLGFPYSVAVTYVLSGTTWVRLRGTPTYGAAIDVANARLTLSVTGDVDVTSLPDVVVSLSTTLHLDSVVAESSVAGDGDDLFPVGYEVGNLGDIKTNGDYATPRVSTRGATYAEGAEVRGSPMVNRGIGIFITPAHEEGDAALRPMGWAAPFVAGDEMSIINRFDAVAGVASIPLLTTTGATWFQAPYARQSGTTFTSDEESGVAAHVKQVNPPTDAAWTRDSDLADVVEVFTVSATPGVWANKVFPQGTRAVFMKIRQTGPMAATATDFVSTGFTAGAGAYILDQYAPIRVTQLDFPAMGGTVSVLTGGGEIRADGWYSVSQNPD